MQGFIDPGQGRGGMYRALHINEIVLGEEGVIAEIALCSASLAPGYLGWALAEAVYTNFQFLA
jgi:hypothetical protein